MRLAALIITVFLISNGHPAWGATASVTLTASASGIGSTAIVTLTATVNNIPTVGQVVFYNGGTIIGSTNTPTSPGGNVYTFAWTPGGGGSYSFSAQVYATNGSLTPVGVNSIVMDNVGKASFGSPATSQCFGEGGCAGSTAWVEADNQFCSMNGDPYNGANTAYPDGSCEWTSTVTSSSNPPSAIPSIATIDSLDDSMHALSDFVTYSKSLLNLDIGTLNSTLNTWAPQAAAWIGPACTTTCTETNFTQCDNTTASGAVPFCNSGGQNGRLLSIYDPSSGAAGGPPQTDIFGSWNATVISPWLKNDYSSSGAWCVPPAATLSSSGPTEYASIVNNSPPASCGDGSTCGAVLADRCQDLSPCSVWGDLPHVISCLNYNAANPGTAGNSAVYAYQACLNLLTTTCPASFKGTACDLTVLGRSLLSPTIEPQPAYSGANKCNPASGAGTTASFAKWVQDSLTLFQDESGKFAARAEFLNDINTRAQTMQTAFNAAHIALGNFFKTCGGCGDGSTCAGGLCADKSACGSPNNKCEDGGPVAQLKYASQSNPAALLLPNAVIYGWLDNPYPDGHQGYAHVVKVTAYSPGRQGAPGYNAPFVQNILPWIKTWSTIALRIYELTNRDGYVYVSVKRWDQDHSGSISFPNKRPLWQFLFSPNSSGITTNGDNGLNPASCVNQGTSGIVPGSLGFGWGLVPQTVYALQKAMAAGGGGAVANDLTAFHNAFMLNDRGDGTVDPTFNTSTYPSPGGSLGTYQGCVTWANNMANMGIESHACARYIASRDPGDVKSGSSGDGASDYSIKFVDCSTISGYNIGAPDDLLSTSP